MTNEYNDTDKLQFYNIWKPDLLTEMTQWSEPLNFSLN